MAAVTQPHEPSDLLERRDRLISRLLGVRRGFGDSARVIHVARSSEARSAVNWTLPVFGILFGLFMLILQKAQSNYNMGSMLVRVFVFDYTLFLFGGLSGWNMARRWRSHADYIEEVSLTPLSPAVVGQTLIAGPVYIWLLLFCVFALIDTVTPFEHIVGLKDIYDSGLDFTFGLIVMIIVAIGHVIGCFVMAWFHFESVKLAHWMFAIHALPRISLVGAGIKNFVAMSGIVILLSGIGSVVTAMGVMILLIVAGLIEAVAGGSGSGMEEAFASYSVWALAAILGALVVILLKRAMCATYERAFTKAWLLFQWWGAGETKQPNAYPMPFHLALPLWISFYGMQEEENAQLPKEKRHHTLTYQLYLKRLQGEQATGAPPVPQQWKTAAISDKSSNSPSPGPDPHNEPLHVPASAAEPARNSESP